MCLADPVCFSEEAEGATPPPQPTPGSVSHPHLAGQRPGTGPPSTSLASSSRPSSRHHWLVPLSPTPISLDWPGSYASNPTIDQHPHPAPWQLPGHFILISYTSHGDNQLCWQSILRDWRARRGARLGLRTLGVGVRGEEKEVSKWEGVDWPIFLQAGSF